mmetsp:Transcript_83700/g.245418  ORF Transcript_83700/g.245418 Transcript_83700/m.245418 type:complete len:214 (-) Transcript_83700:251-892(-)
MKYGGFFSSLASCKRSFCNRAFRALSCGMLTLGVALHGAFRRTFRTDGVCFLPSSVCAFNLDDPAVFLDALLFGFIKSKDGWCKRQTPPSPASTARPASVSIMLRYVSWVWPQEHRKPCAASCSRYAYKAASLCPFRAPKQGSSVWDICLTSLTLLPLTTLMMWGKLNLSPVSSTAARSVRAMAADSGGSAMSPRQMSQWPHGAAVVPQANGC